MQNTIFTCEEDIRFHICALKKIAYADNDFSDVERSFLEDITKIYCISFPSLNLESLLDCEMDDRQFWESMTKLREYPQKARLLLKDMITLGYADGDYCTQEREEVLRIGMEMGIEPDTTHRLETAIENVLEATLQLGNIIDEH